jgi:DUF1009 family protein
MQDDSAQRSPSSGADASRGVALLAGAGQLPIEAAAALRLRGRTILGIGFGGITDPDLASSTSSMHWLELGEMAELSRVLRESKVDDVLLVGKIPKSLLVSGDVAFRPDGEARALLARHRDRSDEGLLALIATWLEDRGLEVLDQSGALPSMLIGSGSLTRSAPDARARADLEVGWPVLRVLGECGVGQCVVVKEGAVLAVEAMEGTDATIARGGRLGGPGASVFKALRAGQDRRFDLPTVGPETIRVMQEVGATALGVEAGGTLIVERDRCIADAEAAGITIWGFDADRESS